MADAGSENLRGFVRKNVLEGSAVLTDRFASYSGLSARGFSHAAIPMRDDLARWKSCKAISVELPSVRNISSLMVENLLARVRGPTS